MGAPDLRALADAVLRKRAALAACPAVPAPSGGTAGQHRETPGKPGLSAVSAPTAQHVEAGQPAPGAAVAAVPLCPAPVPPTGTERDRLPQRPPSIALSIADALADGADREADPDGFLVLIRPDGTRLVVSPGTVAALEAAGLLPPLPPALARSRHAATARPPCWSDPDDVPVEGDRCRCSARRWWTYAPKPDGWCCVTCHPPLHLPAGAVRVVDT